MLQENRRTNFINKSFVLLSLSGFVKLWSALTLLGFYQNRRCAFRVLQVGRMASPNVSSCCVIAWLVEHADRWPTCKNILIWEGNAFQCRSIGLCLINYFPTLNFVKSDSSSCLITSWLHSNEKH